MVERLGFLGNGHDSRLAIVVIQSILLQDSMNRASDRASSMFEPTASEPIASTIADNSYDGHLSVTRYIAIKSETFARRPSRFTVTKTLSPSIAVLVGSWLGISGKMTILGNVVSYVC